MIFFSESTFLENFLLEKYNDFGSHNSSEWSQSLRASLYSYGKWILTFKNGLSLCNKLFAVSRSGTESLQINQTVVFQLPWVLIKNQQSCKHICKICLDKLVGSQSIELLPRAWVCWVGTPLAESTPNSDFWFLDMWSRLVIGKMFIIWSFLVGKGFSIEALTLTFDHK